MKQREDYAEAITIKERLYEESGEGQKSIPANKYGKERLNRSQESAKEPNELTRKLDGDGIPLLFHHARLGHGGNHQTHVGGHRVGTNSEFF